MKAWVHKSHKSPGCFGRYFQCVQEGCRPSACFVFSKQSHCRDGASGSFVWRSPPGSYRFTITYLGIFCPSRVFWWLLIVGKIIFSDTGAGWLTETNLCQSGQGSKLCSCAASSFTSSLALPLSSWRPHPVTHRRKLYSDHPAPVFASALDLCTVSDVPMTQMEKGGWPTHHLSYLI